MEWAVLGVGSVAADEANGMESGFWMAVGERKRARVVNLCRWTSGPVGFRGSYLLLQGQAGSITMCGRDCIFCFCRCNPERESLPGREREDAGRVGPASALSSRLSP